MRPGGADLPGAGVAVVGLVGDGCARGVPVAAGAAGAVTAFSAVGSAVDEALPSVAAAGAGCASRLPGGRLVSGVGSIGPAKIVCPALSLADAGGAAGSPDRVARIAEAAGCARATMSAADVGWVAREEACRTCTAATSVSVRASDRSVGSSRGIASRAFCNVCSAATTSPRAASCRACRDCLRTC